MDYNHQIIENVALNAALTGTVQPWHLDKSKENGDLRTIHEDKEGIWTVRK